MIGKTVNVLVESLKPNGEVSGFTDNYFYKYLQKEVMNFRKICKCKNYRVQQEHH
jgi:hypothetical protein